MRFRFLSILVAVALLLCWGCHSVPAPPGFVGGGTGTAGRIELPSTLSKEAQYALLVCYIDQDGEDAARWAAASLAVAQNARQRLQEELLAEQARPLREKYSDALEVGVDGSLNWRKGTLANRSDWEPLAAMFTEVETFLRQQRALRVPVEEIRDYLTERKDDARLQEFEAWLKKGHETVEIKASEDEPLNRELRNLQKAVWEKQQLLAIEEQATAQMKAGQGLKALELLDEALKGVRKDNSPEILGDYSTRPRLEAMRRQAPNLVIARELQSLSGLPLEEWQSGEERLSKDLLAWRKDGRFVEALGQNAEVIQNQARIFLKQHIQATADYVNQLLSRSDLENYRQVLKFFRKQEDRLFEPSLVEELYCYCDALTEELGKKLVEANLDLHERCLSETGKYLLAMQQRADEIERRFGLVVSADLLLQKLPDLDFMGTYVISPEQLELSRQRAAHAKEMLRKQRFQKNVEIQRISSESPSVGLAWQRDIERRLDEFLRTSSLGQFLQIRTDQPMENTPQAEIVLVDGMLMAYECNSEPERLETRAFRCVSEPHREILDGQYIQYVQELYDQEIVTRAVVRTAHVRLSLAIHLAGKEERRVEINEFLRREFVVEETRPLQAAGKHVVDDVAQVLPMATTPKLRVDRVWSEGEMLDEARRRVLDQVLLQTLEFWTEKLRVRCHDILQQEGSGKPVSEELLEKGGEVVALLELVQPEELLQRLPGLPQNPSEAHAAIQNQLVQALEDLIQCKKDIY